MGNELILYLAFRSPNRPRDEFRRQLTRDGWSRAGDVITLCRAIPIPGLCQLPLVVPPIREGDSVSGRQLLFPVKRRDGSAEG